MTIFLPYYAAALALLYFEVRGSLPRTIPVPRWPAWLWVCGLVATYAAQLGLVWYASAAVVPHEAWRAVLPIGVAGRPFEHAGLVDAAMLALAAMQTYALLGLYRAAPGRALVTAGAVVMVLLSLAAPAFISPDPYAYVGDALLGRASYAPPPHDFGGAFAAIDRFFPSPMLPAPYGPFWTAVVSAVTAPFATLFGKLLALRGLGLLCFVGLLAALHALGLPKRFIAATALNPGIVMQYVACAHNDLLGIVPLVFAAAVVGTSGIAACGLIALAGLVKLPFVVLGLPVLAAVRSRALRYAYGALALALALAISWWGAGSSYFRGLAVHVPAPGPVYILNLAVTFVAVVAIAVAFLGGRRRRSVVWLIPMASSYVASWYVAYGLPYALGRRRVLGYLLVGFPFVSTLVDAKFMQPWTYVAIVPLVAAAYVAWDSGLFRKARA